MAKRKSGNVWWIVVLVLVVAGAAGGVWYWLRRKMQAAANLDLKLEDLSIRSKLLPPELAVTTLARIQNPNNAELKFTRPYLRASINGSQVAQGVASSEVITVPKQGSTTLPLELVISTTELMALGSELRNLIRGGTGFLAVEAWTTVAGQTIKVAEQSVPIPALPGLGFAPHTPGRFVRDASELDHLFPVPDGRETLITPDTDPMRTVDKMREIVSDTLSHTKKAAQRIEQHAGADVRKACEAAFHLLKDHVRYQLDADGTEQLRTPARTWADRETGVDCDCYSIFLSSLLTNLGIEHAYRLGAYRPDEHQHIWVVAFDGADEYALDPVLDRFNQEHPFKYKTDIDV